MANFSGHFSRIASKTSRIVGSPTAFVVSVCIVLVWALSGPMFHFSDTWQLVINTSTTIVTFLIVFLIQNTQNRDSKALHLKLDELIFSIHKADNHLLDIESLSAEELDHLAEKYRKVRERIELRSNSKSHHKL